MFLLDTGVLSAMLTGLLGPRVAAWIAGRPIDLCKKAVSQAEMVSGIAVIREGGRRRQLEAAAGVRGLPAGGVADSEARSHASLYRTIAAPAW
jgi:hypothetical protein